MSIEAILKDGASLLAQDRSVLFVEYTRVVVADGLVFWVKSGVLPGTTALTKSVKGSLHYLINQKQEAEHSASQATVAFTSFEKVDDMIIDNQQKMWIASIAGFQYAFSGHANYYDTAKLWHYSGESVGAYLSMHIVDDLTNPPSAYASNSIAFWLLQNTFFPVYPSFLVPANKKPPYAVCSLKTKTIQAVPFIDRFGKTSQLVMDDVEIKCYGVGNNVAIDFRDSINAIEDLGIMVAGDITDDDSKPTASTYNIATTVKTITFAINYYQERARTMVADLILSAACAVTGNDG